MNRCPECSGEVRSIGTDFFCLDCDFDTLAPITRTATSNEPRLIEVDAQFYTKTQLIKFRKWKNRDFLQVAPFYVSAEWSRKSPNRTQYFDRWSVEAHEQTHLFTDYKRRQTPVPEDEKINALAWTLTVRGEELILNGWTAEMIDQLTPYRSHRWRRKRLFLLCDLPKVSKTFYVGPQVIEIKKHPPYRNRYYF